MTRTPPGRLCSGPPRRALRLWLAGLLASGAAGPAQAAFDCTDAFGNRYVTDQPFGDGADVHCVAAEAPAAPAGPLTAAAAAAMFGLPSSLGADGVSRRGGLVLAPQTRASSWFQAGGSNPFAAPRRTTYDALIDSVAHAYGQDADLLRAIVHVESRANPAAVSAKGAIGLMQIMPATAAGLGLAQPERALFEPESNLRTGALYLRKLFDLFAGQRELVIAAYNAGEGAVMRNGRAIPPFPETQDYVRAVLGVYQQLRARD